MTEDTRLLIERFGLAVGTAAAVYVPAIKKMAMTEALALGTLIREGERDKAIKAVRAKMSNDELAQVAVTQKDLLEAMTDENYARRMTANDLSLAVLKAAFSVLLAVAFL